MAYARNNNQRFTSLGYPARYYIVRWEGTISITDSRSKFSQVVNAPEYTTLHLGSKYVSIYTYPNYIRRYYPTSS